MSPNNCALDDDRALQATDCNLAAIGVIEVKKYRTRYGFAKGNGRKPSTHAPGEFGTAPVHERSKKAGNHRAL